MKQYFETVDVSTGELPEENGSYLVICKKGYAPYFNTSAFHKEKVYAGSNWDMDGVTHWLRPFDISAHDREVAGESWDACRNWIVDESCPDKEEYLNSL